MLAYLEMVFLKLRPAFITLEKLSGEFLDVFKNFFIELNPGLLKSLENRGGFGRTPFNCNYFAYGRIVFMGLVHAFAKQDGFLFARSGLHDFTAEHFYIFPGLALPGLGNRIENRAGQSRTIGTQAQIVLVIRQSRNPHFRDGQR